MRLAARREEIERAALTRIYAIADPTEAAEPQYVEGLKASLAAAVDYGLNAIGSGRHRPPPIPVILLDQARIAARNGVSLDTVLRRYFAGYVLLGDFLIEEADRVQGFERVALKRLLRSLAVLFDRLLTEVSAEHVQEMGVRPESSEQMRAERVRGLLAGELVDTSALSYDFNGSHVGAIASGRDAPQALRAIAIALDRRLLAVAGGEDVVWAWFGGRREIDPEQVARSANTAVAAGVRLAIGEPGEGIGGWRLTHRQARAALPIAMLGTGSFVRYADVALLASVLRDDLLADSLRQLYLAPLACERDGGETLRATLRAYLSSEGNAASAAAVLGVSRQTVVNRLRRAEELIGRTIGSSLTELETALGLESLDHGLLPYASLS